MINVWSSGSYFLSALRRGDVRNTRAPHLSRPDNKLERVLLLWLLRFRVSLYSFSGDASYINSNKMHDIDGYVYGNQPGLSMCIGDRVSWHIMSGILMHSPLFYGNTVTYNGKRTNALGQIQGVENIQTKSKTNKQRHKLERQQTAS